MKIDYDNHITFIYTDSQLKRKFTKEILDKYYNQLSYLYQNGFNFESSSLEEVEEQFLIYNNFENTEDIEELIGVIGKTASYDFGRRILTEEIYDILKNSSFAVNKEVSFSMEKMYAEMHFEKIKEIINRIDALFSSQDLEIFGCLKQLSNFKDIKEKIANIKSSAEKGIKLSVWMNFKTLRAILYSCYVQNSKEKTEIHKFAITSNINDELYGGAGGYNPNTGEIKAWNGTNVYDTRIIKTMPLNAASLLKLKTLATTIIKDTKDAKINDESEKLFKWLSSWTKGFQTDNEKARQIVVNIMLNGSLELLKLKHNLSLLEEKKNYRRAEDIKTEFLAILKYCEVDKDYLL